MIDHQNLIQNIVNSLFTIYERLVNTMTSAAIVQKLWNYCNVLPDDGMSYGKYVEQLTALTLLSR